MDNTKDTKTKLKRYEQWLLILRILAVICLGLGIFFTYRYIKMQRSPGRYGDIYDVCADVLPGLSGKICRSAPGQPGIRSD